MKTVFTSREIAHIWANSGAPHGRSPGNLSFDGDAIKSYATVIGRRIRHGGKVAYVLDRASFSVSTSKSQGRVACAIPETEKVFNIRNGKRGQYLDFTPATLAKWFEERAAAISEEMPSRYAHKRADQWREATAALASARDVLAFFDMGTARLDSKLAARAGQEANAADILKAHGAKRVAAAEAKKRRELKERTARNIAEAEKFLADDRPATRWLDTLEPHRAAAFSMLPAELQARVSAKVNASNASLVSRWLAGKPVELPHGCGTLLRVEGDDMETSKGARVPLADARRTYRFATLARSKGWHRNGETHAIGSYQLDAVNEAGIVAGCHRVTWGEIERFAEAQGWQGGEK
jgi:hypothetical protein